MKQSYSPDPVTTGADRLMIALVIALAAFYRRDLLGFISTYVLPYLTAKLENIDLLTIGLIILSLMLFVLALYMVRVAALSLLAVRVEGVIESVTTEQVFVLSLHRLLCDANRKLTLFVGGVPYILLADFYSVAPVETFKQGVIVDMKVLPMGYIQRVNWDMPDSVQYEKKTFFQKLIAIVDSLNPGTQKKLVLEMGFTEEEYAKYRKVLESLIFSPLLSGLSRGEWGEAVAQIREILNRTGAISQNKLAQISDQIKAKRG